MTLHRPIDIPYPERWLDNFFGSRAAATSGVIRRSRREVDLRIGLERLELEVRRRGFHLLVCGTQYIVVCDRNPIQTLC